MQNNISEHICRVCLEYHETLRCLFDEAEGFHTKLSDLLSDFGDIKVDPDDIYSKYICNECTKELLITTKFRQKCRKTQEILSNFGEIQNDDFNDIIQECDDNDDNGDDHIDSDNNITVDFLKKESNNIIEYTNNDDLESKLTYDDIEHNNEIKLPDSDYIVQENIENESIKIEEDDDSMNYIIFDGDELGDDIIAEIEKSNDEQAISNNQVLYNRIVNAANAAVLKKYKPKSSIPFDKPQTINCNCDICGAGFTHLNNLRKHLETHNLNEIYECSICLWPFSDLDRLELHCISIHTQILDDDDDDDNENHSNEMIQNEKTISPSLLLNEKNITSNVKKKNNSRQNKNNLDSIENNENSKLKQKDTKRNHLCEICEKNFISKSALLTHMRTHTGDRPFKCLECSKTFVTQGGLVLHERRHTGYRPFNCQICGKRFVESSNLKVHIRIHTGEKPHKCTICNRSFSRVFLLQLHQRTHTGEKPYKCSYCGKGFAQQGDLATHKRIHTGEKPYKCSYCEKCFIRSSALKVHLRKHWKKIHKQKQQEDEQEDNMNKTEEIIIDDSRQTNFCVENVLESFNYNDDENTNIKMEIPCKIEISEPIITTTNMTMTNDIDTGDINNMLDDLDVIVEE